MFGDWLNEMEREVREVTGDQMNVSISSDDYGRCEVSLLHSSKKILIFVLLTKNC